MQQAVLGSWSDKDKKRRYVTVDPTAAVVAEQHKQHTKDLSDVLAVLEKAKKSKGLHAEHQLFELEPFLGLLVADKPTG